MLTTLTLAAILAAPASAQETPAYTTESIPFSQCAELPAAEAYQFVGEFQAFRVTWIGDAGQVPNPEAIETCQPDEITVVLNTTDGWQGMSPVDADIHEAEIGLCRVDIGAGSEEGKTVRWGYAIDSKIHGRSIVGCASWEDRQVTQRDLNKGLEGLGDRIGDVEGDITKIEITINGTPGTNEGGIVGDVTELNEEQKSQGEDISDQEERIEKLEANQSTLSPRIGLVLPAETLGNGQFGLGVGLSGGIEFRGQGGWFTQADYAWTYQSVTAHSVRGVVGISLNDNLDLGVGARHWARGPKVGIGYKTGQRYWDATGTTGMVQLGWTISEGDRGALRLEGNAFVGKGLDLSPDREHTHMGVEAMLVFAPAALSW